MEGEVYSYGLMTVSLLVHLLFCLVIIVGFL